MKREPEPTRRTPATKRVADTGASHGLAAFGSSTWNSQSRFDDEAVTPCEGRTACGATFRPLSCWERFSVCSVSQLYMKTEKKMRNLIIAGTTLLSFALAAPAGAAALSRPDACRAQYPNANCLNTGPGGPSYREGGYYNAYRGYAPYGYRHGAFAAVPFGWENPYVAWGVGY